MLFIELMVFVSKFTAFVFSKTETLSSSLLPKEKKSPTVAPRFFNFSIPLVTKSLDPYSKAKYDTMGF